jgi:hypothetical protein
LSAAIAAHFELQAQNCETMGSPLTAAVCRLAFPLLDPQTQTGARILGWRGDPRGDALALRLCGALHALVLSGAEQRLVAAYPPNAIDSERLSAAIAAALVGHDGFINHFLGTPPQTNEIARSAALLPGLLQIARQTGLPVRLHEIGSSAGLNLFADRFSYRFGSETWGAGRSAPVLVPEMRGIGAPDLSGKLQIAGRHGNDIAPLDIHAEQDRLRLRSYLWADQPERLARLDAAVAVAGDVGGFSVVALSAEKFVDQHLQLRDGECALLMHSVVWQYLPATVKSAITSVMEQRGGEATSARPLAWLTMEGLGGVDPFATVSLRSWPGGHTYVLARCDFHARWIEWLDWSGYSKSWLPRNVSY